MQKEQLFGGAIDVLRDCRVPIVQARPVLLDEEEKNLWGTSALYVDGGKLHFYFSVDEFDNGGNQSSISLCEELPIEEQQHQMIVVHRSFTDGKYEWSIQTWNVGQRSVAQYAVVGKSRNIPVKAAQELRAMAKKFHD